MIDHNRKLVLLHPSRTGGTSVENMLGFDIYAIGRLNDPQLNLRLSVAQYGDEPALQHRDLTKHEIPIGYRTVTTVRDPYKRAASMLSYMNKYKTIEELVMTLPKSYAWTIPQHMYTHIDGVLRVSDILRICDGECIGWSDFSKRYWLPDIPIKRNSRATVILTEQDRSFVRDFYRKDFELLGYNI